MEVYFDILDNKNVVELCRFRTANHKLPIEIGRWNNTNRNNRMFYIKVLISSEKL
jgi:hypothetical protein